MACCELNRLTVLKSRVRHCEEVFTRSIIHARMHMVEKKVFRVEKNPNNIFQRAVYTVSI